MCEGLSKHAHFQNFGMAFLTLFRIATGDNWNGIMKARTCDNLSLYLYGWSFVYGVFNHSPRVTEMQYNLTIVVSQRLERTTGNRGVLATEGSWQPRGPGNRGVLATEGSWQPRGPGNRGVLATEGSWQPRGPGNRGVLATEGSWQPRGPGNRGVLATEGSWQPRGPGNRGVLATEGSWQPRGPGNRGVLASNPGRATSECRFRVRYASFSNTYW